MNGKHSSWRNVTLLLLVGMLGPLVLASCTPTHQTRSVKPSGFLGDYSKFKKGEEGQALLVYVNPKADFKKYDKIIIDPIAIYAAKDSDLHDMSKKDLEALASYLDAALRRELNKEYTIVTESGPGVLRLRAAMTEAEGSMVVMDTISTVLPIGLAISAGKRIVFGTHTGVGLARLEGEIVDSVTNTRLLGAVDERAGRKFTGKFDKLKKWQDVKDAFDYWADRTRTRLVELRDK